MPKNDLIDVKQDLSLGTLRDKILCSKCGDHLEHVFNYGPNPTGKKFCVNSIFFNF